MAVQSSCHTPRYFEDATLTALSAADQGAASTQATAPTSSNTMAPAAQLLREQNEHLTELTLKAAKNLYAALPPGYSAEVNTSSAPFVDEVAMATWRCVHALAGTPESAERRWEKYYEGHRFKSSLRVAKAIKALLPPRSRCKGANMHSVMRCATAYITSNRKRLDNFRTGENVPEKQNMVNGQSSSGNAARLHVRFEEDSDVEFLASYDYNIAKRLPIPPPQTITQEQKIRIDKFLGDADHDTLRGVLRLVQDSDPQVMDDFMKDSRPNVDMLPENVLVQIQRFIESHSSQIKVERDASVADSETGRLKVKRTKAGKRKARKNGEKAVELNKAKATPELGKTLPDNGKQKALEIAPKTVTMTMPMMLHDAQQEIRALRAAMRASGKDEDSIDEYVVLYKNGASTADAIEGAGWLH